MPENEQWETFLKFWTLKEACAKALGLGAMLDFRELEVLFNPLSVVAKKGLLGLDETLDVETSETLIDQVFYRISIARISNSTGDTEFCLRPLA